MMKYWLCYGKQDKWQAALEYSKWGVKELAANGMTSSPARDWEHVQNGDVLIFLLGDGLLYGYGTVIGKSDKETKPIWPDELQREKVIYNRRLDVEFIEKCIDERGSAKIAMLEAPGHAGLSELSEQEAYRAVSAMKTAWKIDDSSKNPAPTAFEDFFGGKTLPTNSKIENANSSPIALMKIIKFILWGIIGIVEFFFAVLFGIIILFLQGIIFLFTGGKFGHYVWGKNCPRCWIRRINTDRECCGRCYRLYYSR